MSFQEVYNAGYVIIGYAAIAIMSIVLHEIAHGYVAYRCGDPTAYLAGRLTLNPIKHIDPFMTIAVPALCLFLGLPVFGGAKPVPVNPYLLKRRVVHGRLVSLAGVVVNLAIAWVLALLLHLLLKFEVVTPSSPHAIVLGMAIFTNVVLFVFNLMPIPPLDGSHVLRSFLPESIRQVFNSLDRWGLILLVIALSTPVFFDVMKTGIAVVWVYVLRFDGELYAQIWQGFHTVSHL